MASVRVSRQVTGGYDELCTEDRAHPGQRFDDLGLRMGAKCLVDLTVDTLESVIQAQNLGSQIGDDLRGDVLTGQRGVLSLRSLQRGGGDYTGAADASVSKPWR